MSCIASRLSKSIEALIASITSSGPAANRPPHIAFAPFGSVSSLISLRAPLVLAALLYGAAAGGANAEGLSAADLQALKGLRQGQMQTLVIHDAPQPALEVGFTDAAGAPMDYGAFKGKVILVNFWATWCIPCRREMPTLDNLQAQLGGPDFTVAAISSDRTAEQAQRFFDEIGVDKLTLYHDPRAALARASRVIGYPVVLILDRQGRELARLTGGAEWDSLEAVRLLRRVIDMTSEARE